MRHFIESNNSLFVLYINRLHCFGGIFSLKRTQALEKNYFNIFKLSKQNKNSILAVFFFFSFVDVWYCLAQSLLNSNAAHYQQFSMENIKRLKQALFPPSPSTMHALCEEGHTDAVQFLKREDLMS
ncbi:hypothetical protein ATANTOWER_026501 [Ataeniobius toweri]|uniref:Uncharacterized protein n=1 Tax=Ataeniobius toweri TaxID=208326 RepID=A0ABU7AH35_9TELE|nr:hypothetical protein [Ataeniobius toweri]